MDRPGHQLLAGPGLPQDQHRVNGVDVLVQQREDLPHRPALSHDLTVVVAIAPSEAGGAELLANLGQLDRLLLQLALQGCVQLGHAVVGRL